MISYHRALTSDHPNWMGNSTTYWARVVFMWMAFLLWPGINDAPWAQDNPIESLNLPYHFDPFEIQNPGYRIDPAKISVTCIAQDSFGYMWFGTRQRGLFRYDGRSFVTYANDLITPYGDANGIWSILVDSQGRLWVGTQGGGLVFFDSTTETFKQYLFESSNPQSLSSNFVRTIAEDSMGRIWVGTTDGLNRLDLLTEQFKRYYPVPEDSTGLRLNSVYKIYVDRQGVLWAGSSTLQGTAAGEGRGGLNRYDPETDNFTLFTHNPNDSNSLINNRINEIYEDSKGNFWVGTQNDGLHLMDRKAESFKHFPYDPSQPKRLSRPYISYRYPYDGDLSFTGIGGSKINFIRESHTGKLWIGARPGGINIFDPKSNTQVHLEANEKNEGVAVNGAFAFFESHDGVIWLSSRAGFGRAATGGTWPNKVFKITPNQPDLFNYYSFESMGDSIMVNQIVEDDSGSLWVALSRQAEGRSVFRGIFRFDLETSTFKQHFYSPNLTNVLKEDTIRVVTLDSKGRHWLATLRGLYCIDPLTENFTFYRNDSLHIIRIYEAQGGKLWLHTRGKGLNQFDPTTESYTQYRHNPEDPTSLPNDTIITLLVDQQKRLWVAPRGGGLCLFNSKLETFVCYHHDSVTDNNVGHNNSYYWYTQSPDESIWFSGNRWEGDREAFLDQFDPKTGRFTHHINSFPRGIVFSQPIVFDQEDQIWALTIRGLLRYDPQNKEVVKPSLKFGLDPLPPRNFFFDSSGYLWIVKERSISRISLSDGISATLPNLKVSLLGSYYESSEGEYFFSAQGGLLSVDPKELAEIQAQTLATQIKFTAFYSLGKPLRTPVSEWKIQSLQLQHSESTVTIKFLVTNFQTDDPLTITYKLENYDQEWREISEVTEVDYIKIPRGNYTFRVRAVTNLGQVTEKSLKITVLPPWWQSNWAYATYAVLILSLFWGIYRMLTLAQRHKIVEQERVLTQQQQRLEKERQLNERLKTVDRLKDQFLANTSHELRTPLQGIIGLSESLVERVDKPDQQEDLSMIISSSRRLNNLVNDIMDFSKLRNFDLELMQKSIDLRALTDIVLKNIAPLAKGKNLELVNAVPWDLPAAFADENRLQQILYNLVGNSIKFTETGYVKLTAIEKEHSLQISVEDTGTGIAENKREAIFQEFEQGDGSTSREFAGTGLGLSISKRLVELHGGQMWVESAVEKGSTFFFTLPISTKPTATLIPNKETADPIQQAIFLTDKTKSVVLPKDTDEDIRILIVDDEPINQRVLKNHLFDMGFQLRQAMNGEEALKAIEINAPFDLVLLDIMMPRMSGYEVCEKIRQKYLPSELPIIMVTANNQVQDLVQGLNMGANDYLAKPFTKAEFLARVKTQLNLHRINSATGRFVPHEFIRSLGREGITDVQLGDLVERDVTMFFSDIRRYTQLAEKMSPQENFRFVNAYTGRMGPIIQTHRGFINQYLGDGILAIFQHSAKDALLAAIEMQKEIQIYNQFRLAKNRVPIQVGMGLHTGPLIMGIIGDKNRLDAATISDAVNTASRMEGLTKHYGVSILLSEDSWSDLGHPNTFSLRYLGQVQVKGKEKPIGIHECFNGDQPEIIDKKLATKELFEKGLQAFFTKDFAEAAMHLKSVLQQHPDDLTAQLFYKKTGEYITRGVPENWTGVQLMLYK